MPPVFKTGSIACKQADLSDVSPKEELAMCKIAIIEYSMYGHIYKMAEAVAEGVRGVPGCEAVIKRVPETLTAEVLGMMGALEAQKGMAHIPVATVDDLAEADAVIFGTPTRFGNMCGQMRQFLDATGGLWMKGTLVGKPASVFTSSATQHGGQESTILSFHTTLLHQGMIVIGLPYSFAGQMGFSEVTGCSPYGASTITGGQGERMPSENELAGARFQGAHVARIALKLKG
jgi:NAD(P)H dehydrogenase (quinone)